MSAAREPSRLTEVIQLGADAQVDRKNIVIVPGRWAETDPFLALAEDWFAQAGFGDHPHRGFETVTLVLEGSLAHRDSRGGEGVLGPGDVQWMTAGRGVIHSEQAHGGPVHALQLWVNLPADRKLTEPRWQDLRGAAAPVRRVEGPSPGGGATLRLYAGCSGGLRGPAQTHSPITFAELRLAPGARLEHDLPAGERAFVYPLAGRLLCGAAGGEVLAGSVAWFDPLEGDEAAPGAIALAAADEPVHALLCAGRPLRQPVVAKGPFVMSTQAEVAQAYRDYARGQFG